MPLLEVIEILGQLNPPRWIKKDGVIKDFRNQLTTLIKISRLLWTEFENGIERYEELIRLTAEIDHILDTIRDGRRSSEHIQGSLQRVKFRLQHYIENQESRDHNILSMLQQAEAEDMSYQRKTSLLKLAKQISIPNRVSMQLIISSGEERPYLVDLPEQATIADMILHLSTHHVRRFPLSDNPYFYSGFDVRYTIGDLDMYPDGSPVTDFFKRALQRGRHIHAILDENPRIDVLCATKARTLLFSLCRVLSGNKGPIVVLKGSDGTLHNGRDVEETLIKHDETSETSWEVCRFIDGLKQEQSPNLVSRVPSWSGRLLDLCGQIISINDRDSRIRWLIMPPSALMNDNIEKWTHPVPKDMRLLSSSLSQNTSGTDLKRDKISLDYTRRSSLETAHVTQLSTGQGGQSSTFTTSEAPVLYEEPAKMAGGSQIREHITQSPRPFRNCIYQPEIQEQRDSPSPHIVSSDMSVEEMFDSLVRHGCTDLTSSIEFGSISSGVLSYGGFGDVRQARMKNGILIAVKCLRLCIAREQDQKGRKRAMRELHHWSKACHENIQELLGVIIFQGRLGMISLWMENGHLGEYIGNNRDTDRYQLVRIFLEPEFIPHVSTATQCVQVATGVKYLHGIGMVHGDIKTMNILVSADGIVKISDFDYSILPESTLHFSKTERPGGGTHRWMAPELLLPEEESDEPPVTRNKKTDIYALGMTMLEILTGDIPYKELKHEHSIYKVVAKKQFPKRPRQLPESNEQANKMWSLLVQCWDHDPKLRPDATSVLEQLQALMLE